MKDKRIIPLGVARFLAEVEFFDGTVTDCGTHKKISDAQAELDRYARDVSLYRNNPQSVFIKHPIC